MPLQQPCRPAALAHRQEPFQGQSATAAPASPLPCIRALGQSSQPVAVSPTGGTLSKPASPHNKTYVRSQPGESCAEGHEPCCPARCHPQLGCLHPCSLERCLCAPAQALVTCQLQARMEGEERGQGSSRQDAFGLNQHQRAHGGVDGSGQRAQGVAWRKELRHKGKDESTRLKVKQQRMDRNDSVHTAQSLIHCKRLLAREEGKRLAAALRCPCSQGSSTCLSTGGGCSTAGTPQQAQPAHRSMGARYPESPQPCTAPSPTTTASLLAVRLPSS